MRIKLKISRNSSCLSSFSQEELQEVQKQLLLELRGSATTMGLFFWLGSSSNVAMGRLNQLWISDKAQDDLPMAVVDYKKML
jgi:hypothetical protein